ncbi:serine-rich adhesin for platelets isoform X3 [Eupeodes corollae]|uniref:serine-rich adhesin for platelets isoform X3 n=1 Tax=Eupeodes corollae TaxID=290404 RepID=UPI002490D107|nr:serine-rich adhesin for platelets isoform X3 [Eupeodes corollae]
MDTNLNSDKIRYKDPPLLKINNNYAITNHNQLLNCNYYLQQRRSLKGRTAKRDRICSNPMGKCISKQPSAITIALSTTDLATANHILSKFSDKTDYISLKDELGNPLYEYFGEGKTEIFYCPRKDNSNLTTGCWKESTLTTTTESTEDTNNNRNYRRNRQEREAAAAAAARAGVPVDCNSFGDTGCGLDNEGQSESKKSSKKAGGPETKGTAMSFGFRKKLHTTPKKSKNLQKQKEMLENNLTQNCDEKTKQKHNFDTVIMNTADVMVENIKTAGTTTTTTGNSQKNDKNGNTESTTTIPSSTTTTTTPMVTFEKVGAGKTQHQTTTQGVPNDNTTAVVGRSILSNGGGTGTGGGGAINRSNRFGFKGTNTVRPASTGITPRYQSDFQDNVDNNNYSQAGNYNNINNNNINSTIKRRSKSAHSGRAMTPNLSNLDRQQQFDESRHQPHAPKITQKSLNYHSNEYQRSRLQFLQHQQPHQPQQQAHRPTPCLVNPPQYTFVNTGMHTNVIVRPTPRPPSATFSKFTLQTTSLPKPEYPVPIRLAPSSSSSAAAAASTTTSTASASSSTAASAPQMDQKTAKQMANNNRKGFQGSREISADSGIASLDTTLTEPQPTQPGSPRRNRSRPRNLQMVMSGRHKFEVRDLEDPLSSSDSAVEPLALPKLPSAFSSDNQTVPLSGLIRSNTVLTREAFFRSTGSTDEQDSTDIGQHQKTLKNTSDSEGLEEEKLFLDRSTSEKCAKSHQFKDINTFSKNSSPGSSRTSWCNAGESLAIKDCSSLSISSSDESKDNHNEKTDAILPITEDISPTMISDIAISSISSITESGPQLEIEQQDEKIQKDFEIDCDVEADVDVESKPERPISLTNITESKFAEMAAAVASEFLLDDETSPTDSLVSSTESEDVVCKRQKKKNNLEIQEKDIDEISPEFEVCSPLSPGTPTHASHSLSLSDCGRDFLIDDEIADQPALLFNESNDGIELGAHVGHSHTDTPTLMETGSMRSLKSQSKARSALQAAIELSLRTPVSLRKVVLNRAESLDTLSPCESICSDDMMMDFDVNSSMDSIDNRMSASIRSRSGSALHKMDDSQMLSELEGKGSDMMRELNTILRVHNRNEKDNNMIAHLPARATRLLNRSRLQQCQLSNNGSDSPKSTDSFRRTPSRASSLHHSQRDTNSSSDDLMLHDKSFRNAMIQDVLHFKKQLLRLRRILQEDEECLMRTDTLNPFDTTNGQLFASCGLDTKFLEDIDVASLTSSTTDDPVQELADLRRQGQVDDRDRTIRIQKTLIDKLESDNGKYPQILSEKECVNTATQTERTRPLSIGPEGLSRSKPEYTSYTTHFPATTIITTTTSPPLNNNSNGAASTQQALTPTNNQTRRHTVISTTFTNYNQISPSPRRASIAWEQQRPNNAATVVYKPVKITLIGDPMCQMSTMTTASEIKGKHNGSISPTTPVTKSCNGGDLKVNSSSNTNSSSSSSSSSDLVVDEENRRNLLNGYHNKHHHNNNSCNGKENGYEEIEVRNRNHHNHHHQNINHLKKHNHQLHLPQLNQQQQQKKQQNLTPTVTIV